MNDLNEGVYPFAADLLVIVLILIFLFFMIHHHQAGV